MGEGGLSMRVSVKDFVGILLGGLDRNGDGRLKVGEEVVPNGFKIKMGLSATETSADRIPALLQGLDAMPKDGYVCSEELRRAAEAADADGDGVLDLSEIKAALQRQPAP